MSKCLSYNDKGEYWFTELKFEIYIVMVLFETSSTIASVVNISGYFLWFPFFDISFAVALFFL